MLNGRLVENWVISDQIPVITPLAESHVTRALESAAEIMKTLKASEGSARWRKERPVYSGVMKYFPDALLEVAHVSFIGNEQHNPGQPLHWAREKSADQLDALGRHLIDNAAGRPHDADDVLHMAKIAWRALAELQLTIERAKTPTPKASCGGSFMQGDRCFNCDMNYPHVGNCDSELARAFKEKA